MSSGPSWSAIKKRIWRPPPPRIKGHLFQGSDIVRLFFEQGLWATHPNQVDITLSMKPTETENALDDPRSFPRSRASLPLH